MASPEVKRLRGDLRTTLHVLLGMVGPHQHGCHAIQEHWWRNDVVPVRPDHTVNSRGRDLAANIQLFHQYRRAGRSAVDHSVSLMLAYDRVNDIMDFGALDTVCGQNETYGVTRMLLNYHTGGILNVVRGLYPEEVASWSANRWVRRIERPTPDDYRIAISQLAFGQITATAD